MQDNELASGSQPIGDGPFRFACHPGIACFTKCCRDVDMYLYPYDIIRMKNRLGITSGEFLDKYTTSAFRDNPFFPSVMLRMAGRPEKPCPFLSPEGCTVYDDRPSSCREYPLERAVGRMRFEGRRIAQYFVKRVPHCLGHRENTEWTVEEWVADQEIGPYQEMNDLWVDVDTAFRSNPWGDAGAAGNKLKMAFMACFNVDQFRRFVLESSFRSRFEVGEDHVEQIKTDDVEMMKFGFNWVQFFLTGRRPESISGRKSGGS